MKMDDLQVKNAWASPWPKAIPESSKAPDPFSDFKTILNRSVEEVNQFLTEANQSAQEMVLGKMDIHQAMVAIEKANVSFRLMVQVRNKMIAAYEEIMRMQI